MRTRSVSLTLHAVALGALLAIGNARAIENSPSAGPALKRRQAVAAIDRHALTRSLDYRFPKCVPMGYRKGPEISGRRGFDGARFDFTPAGFRVVIDAANESDPQRRERAKLELLASVGYLTKTSRPDGAAEFTMTWKGFVNMNDAGCVYAFDGRPSSTIVSWTSKRSGRTTVYDVVARVSYGTLRDWVKSNAFAEAFGQPAVASLQPKTKRYTLVPNGGGYTVIAEDGHSVFAQQVDEAMVAAYEKFTGPINAETVKRMLQADLDRRGHARARLCLPLPSRLEIHDSNYYAYAWWRDGGPGNVEPFFSFYNLVEEPTRQRQDILRGYAKMLKVEALGLATSRRIAATEFGGAPARGEIRFTLVRAALKPFALHPDNCIEIGRLVVDKVLSLQPVATWRVSSRFSARLEVVPAGPPGAKAIERFGNLRRMSTVGLGIHERLVLSARGVLFSGPILPLAFDPDVSRAALPVLVDEK